MKDESMKIQISLGRRVELQTNNRHEMEDVSHLLLSEDESYFHSSGSIDHFYGQQLERGRQLERLRNSI